MPPKAAQIGRQDAIQRWSCCALLLLPLGFATAAQLNAVVTDAAGKPLADAALYLLPQAGDTALPKPRDANIDQQNRTFVPTVSVLQTGTAVHFPNSDNIRHQVYSFSPAKVFNLKLYSGRPSEPVIFDKPGTVVLGCNIHDQMVAWVLAVDTAWFAKTDAAGRLSINSIPEGAYWLHAWHPGLRKPLDRQAILFGAASVVERNLALDASPIPKAHDMAGH